MGGGGRQVLEVGACVCVLLRSGWSSLLKDKRGGRGGLSEAV